MLPGCVSRQGEDLGISLHSAYSTVIQFTSKDSRKAHLAAIGCYITGDRGPVNEQKSSMYF